MKVIIAALGLLVPSTHSQLTETQKAEILQQHNDLRKQTADGNTLCAYGQYCPSAQSIPDLQWDAGLAKLAQDYADTCVMGHEDNSVRASRFQGLGGSSNFPGQYSTGENLAWGSCSLDSSGSCMATYRWGEKEAVCWDHDANANTGCVTGHFTQMIWANTQYVGCGWRGGDCTQYGGMLVCNYYPPGNYIGQSPYVATFGSGDPVQPTTPTPPPTTEAPTEPPVAPPTAPVVVNPIDGDLECVYMENSAFGGYFDGTWTVGGTSQGKTYWTKDSFVLEWVDYHSGWAIKTGLGGMWYMYCANQASVTDCGAGTWTQAYGDVAQPHSYVEGLSCAGGFTNEDESNVNGTSDSDGWKVVLVVVIIGFLLIGAGNVAWCMYMKRQMMGKHNMEKVYNEAELAKNDEEIEVNFEVTS